MSEFLMDLADCGSPERLVEAIVKHHPDMPRKTPIEDLATSVGITDFLHLENDSFEGALVANQEKTSGVIFTREGRPAGRHRFTIAHELGHFLLPSHKAKQQCTLPDLMETRQDNEHRRREAEANRFAAGVLMPKARFSRDIRRLVDADVGHVQTLAEQYDTSLEATANRYVELSDERCAFVFSHDGIVRYARASATFPRLAIRTGDALPVDCLSAKPLSSPIREASSWATNDGSVWLETERGKPTRTVQEQFVRQSKGYLLTLLSIEPEDEDESEEEELEESWTPRFRR